MKTSTTCTRNFKVKGLGRFVKGDSVTIESLGNVRGMDLIKITNEDGKSFDSIPSQVNRFFTPYELITKPLFRVV